MKKILIITSHYPPSNLAAVHRSRLFAQHLPSFGWDPILLTVDEKYYEEELDWNLFALLPIDQRIEKVKAFSITKPRLIGDLGLRAFFQLRNRALHLIQTERIDFVYIPIPSFYVSLIGDWINKKTGVPYGIDYIDPWVHKFPGSDRMFSRHWFSTFLAKWLEPYSIKNAACITAVAEGYYEGVIERNFYLSKSCFFKAMPYGGEIEDHLKLQELNLPTGLFEKNNKLQMVYAGALLPKSFEILENIFRVLGENRDVFSNLELHFIGTGKLANDSNSYNVKSYAEKFGIWEYIVFEYPKRIPYLNVLAHLALSDAIFILGSTESHYTPSKTYQAVLSHKPIFAVLHEDSTAVGIIENSNAGKVLTLNSSNVSQKIENEFLPFFNEFRVFSDSFRTSQVDMQFFEKYSAKSITGQLVDLLNQVIGQK